MMGRAQAPKVIWLAVLAGLWLAGAAAAAEVSIVYPKATETSYGELEVAAEVTGVEQLERVDFYVDGRLAGSRKAPPFRLKVDVGWENQAHSYRVVAVSRLGNTEATVTTPAIVVDEQVQVNLKQLYVTVTSGGKRALNLDRGDFEVYDDGKKQEIITFERGEVPITAVVLLDVSESMVGERLAKALEGARIFVDGLADLDQAMVLLFSDRVVRTTAFSNQRPVLHAALTGVEAHGGTAVNDHVYLALKQLDGQPTGRPVIVLFSDGTDVHSVLSMREVVWKASRSQALLYWISLEGEGKAGGDTISTAWRNGEASKEEAQLLRDAVETSGGEIYKIAEPEELAGAFRAILAELREQYVIGYYPSNARGDGSWHKVKVEAKGFSRARHRGGYVDE